MISEECKVNKIKIRKGQVSVIVPMYNSEKYVEKCLDSILSNNYKNIEVLVVDDGSTDNSYDVVRKISSSKIRLFGQDNRGASSARNLGLENAQGEFVIFIDSDDYVSSDFVSVLVQELGTGNLGISGVKYINSVGQCLVERRVKNNTWMKFKMPLNGGKIYRNDFLKKNKIFYPKFFIGEDILFNMMCYSKTNNIKCIEYSGYNYLQHDKSTMHQINKKIDVMKLLEKIDEIAFDSGQINRNELIFFLKKTLVHNIFLNKYSMTIDEQNKQLSCGLNFIRKRGGKYLQIEFHEGVIMNLGINFLIICNRLGLGKIAIRIINSFSYMA